MYLEPCTTGDLLNRLQIAKVCFTDQPTNVSKAVSFQKFSVYRSLSYILASNHVVLFSCFDKVAVSFIHLTPGTRLVRRNAAVSLLAGAETDTIRLIQILLNFLIRRRRAESSKHILESKLSGHFGLHSHFCHLDAVTRVISRCGISLKEMRYAMLKEVS